MWGRMSAVLKAHVERAEQANKLRSAALHFQYTQTIQRQRDEREKLTQAIEKRWAVENAAARRLWPVARPRL